MSQPLSLRLWVYWPWLLANSEYSMLTWLTCQSFANHPPGAWRRIATRRLSHCPAEVSPWKTSDHLCYVCSGVTRHSARGLVLRQTGVLNSLRLLVLRGCVPYKLNILRLDVQPRISLPLFLLPNPPPFSLIFLLPSTFSIHLFLPFFLLASFMKKKVLQDQKVYNDYTTFTS